MTKWECKQAAVQGFEDAGVRAQKAKEQHVAMRSHPGEEWLRILNELESVARVAPGQVGARGGSRTHTPFRAADFESAVSAIPPLGLALNHARDGVGRGYDRG